MLGKTNDFPLPLPWRQLALFGVSRDHRPWPGPCRLLARAEELEYPFVTLRAKSCVCLYVYVCCRFRGCSTTSRKPLFSQAPL